MQLLGQRLKTAKINLVSQFRVGCVPYVNARPLVAAFDQPNEFVEVVYDVPSRLPALLDSGEVDAILVSSIELLRRDDLLPVSEVGIMSYGPVRSVRMLSKVPLKEIKTLALDQSSLTSNVLAQIILAEQGVFPKTETLSPDASDMLAHHDACVLIGDKGFEADGTGLVDIDLGEAWTSMTGLPFVWALWLGKSVQPLNFTLLSALLHGAYSASGFEDLHGAILLGRMTGRGPEEEPEYEASNLPEALAHRNFVIRSAVDRSNWTYEQIDEYLTYHVEYEHFDMERAIEKFVELLNKHGLGPAVIPLALRRQDLQRMVMDLIPDEKGSQIKEG